ncbi:MAG: type III pantothenate kinase [Gammaproteobacteria bacterium]|tara:strand:+ start:797 stop:1537 length:741 start_codon:yes stop_codon:yes gene_type:complete
MKLLIDIGNTTSSFGLWGGSKLSMTTNIENKKFLFTAKKYIKNDINKILFISVISKLENEKIKNQLKKLFKCKIKQIKSTSNLLKIKNGYTQPAKLGDDRWATIVASFIFYKEPLIIIDCGTAVSIDMVNKKGRHMGGYILAGFDGYKKSFKSAYHLKDTKIKQSISLQKKTFPKQTSEGITKGYLIMIISTIESLYNQIIKNEKVFPKILISGGYGEIISKNLSVKNKYERNLVLKSLGIISDLS